MPRKTLVERALIQLEKELREVRVLEVREKYTTPKQVSNYCVLKLAKKEHEVFAVMFLDNQHRLIKFVEMFRGTINSSTVYPREIAKEALGCNAAACIIMHNHPSGSVAPSVSDDTITREVKKALELLDIRLLDHIIVGGMSAYISDKSCWKDLCMDWMTGAITGYEVQTGMEVTPFILPRFKYEFTEHVNLYSIVIPTEVAAVGFEFRF